MRVSSLTFALLYTLFCVGFSYATSRRILHQPFFPQDSPPPQTPPPPPASKLPFSGNTPDNSPFFPTYPSPPPPPSPSAFATFPANISSLVVPQSPKPKNNPRNTLVASLSVVFSCLLLLGIFVILRRRRSNDRNTPDDKSNSRSFYASDAGPAQTKLTTNSTSSEFLYLGTVINSHNVEAENTNPPTNNGSDRMKPDSPELHPLPPLDPRRNYRDGETTDDNEEFYSPRVSLGTGSGSGQVYTSAGVDKVGSSSTCTGSSSDSGSPDRLNSPDGEKKAGFIGCSSLSSSGLTSPNQLTPPRRTDEDLVTQTSPERDFNRNNSNRPISLPRIISLSSGQNGPCSSCSSSIGCSSPERGLNARISSLLEQPVTVTPPPPPPPPPPPRPQWDSPVVVPIVSRPPPLVPPSRPFVFRNSGRMEEESVEESTLKPKLKPLHWDKVRASSDREMVWDHLSSSSFKLNEEMIETLFVVNNPTLKPNQHASQPWSVIPTLHQDTRVLDPKKAQNIAILLRALNVTNEEVCEALLEGNADALGAELLESLMKMAPTKEEERKLMDYRDDSPTKLGHAEKFLKAVLDVPFAFKRVGAMLYVANFETEAAYLRKSFETLEVACGELRNSRMFLKLLEAVLKTGNRMNVGTNRGDAHAFKLDTLLKLVDVKGADGKTTLLHFVVQEITRTEGSRVSGANQNPDSNACEDAKCRKLGLQVVQGLSSELASVKKAAGMDSDILSADVSKLSRGLQDIGEVVRLNEMLVSDESSEKFSESMKRFVKMAEEEIVKIKSQESTALSLVKEITEYFHGNLANEEAHPFRIFMVVRDFLGILDRVCKEVGMANERTIINSAYKFPVPVNPTLQPQVF